MRSRPLRRCSKPTRWRSGSWLSMERIAGEIRSSSRLAMWSHSASTRLLSALSRDLPCVPAPGARRILRSVDRLGAPRAATCAGTRSISNGTPLSSPATSPRRPAPPPWSVALRRILPWKPSRAVRSNTPAGCASRPGRYQAVGSMIAGAILVVPAIWVVLWRHVGVTGPVGSHRTSPPSRSTGCC